jgi:hypothetical protein
MDGGVVEGVDARGEDDRQVPAELPGSAEGAVASSGVVYQSASA